MKSPLVIAAKEALSELVGVMATIEDYSDSIDGVVVKLAKALKAVGEDVSDPLPKEFFCNGCGSEFDPGWLKKALSANKEPKVGTQQFCEGCLSAGSEAEQEFNSRGSQQFCERCADASISDAEEDRRVAEQDAAEYADERQRDQWTNDAGIAERVRAFRAGEMGARRWQILAKSNFAGWQGVSTTVVGGNQDGCYESYETAIADAKKVLQRSALWIPAAVPYLREVAIRDLQSAVFVYGASYQPDTDALSQSCQ